MDRFQSILHEYWGYDNFRGIQREIIESVCSGRDTLGLMPTGGGKSITFQVSALALGGTCLVVTPLIALMKDQVQQLRARGIQAEAVYSGMRNDRILQIYDNAIFGAVKLLYLSPERLSSPLFLSKLQRMKISLITVDEAHCISQWGYDFRPQYLLIAKIRELLPQVPVLALTATATQRTIADIQEQLHFREKCVFSMSFRRENLAYVVRHTDDKEGQLVHILQSLQGSAIVYVRSRAHTTELARTLANYHISATYYHAGLDRAVKDQHQNDWTKEKYRVMVATNAFGMGIDKQNVRLVVHYQVPDSIEAYFQEAGRAGRDGKRAYAVLLFAQADREVLLRRVKDNFPPRPFIRQIYEELGSFYQIAEGMGAGHTFLFDIDRFSVNFHHFPTQVHAALTLLSHARYIEYVQEPDARSRVKFLITRAELSRLNHLAPTEEALVTEMLRHYGGLFADYVYIDEGLLMDCLHLDRQQVYLLLKGLSTQRIIHYIPQQQMPQITFLQPRLDAELIVINEAIYEQRLAQYQANINAMLQYVSNDASCRSRQLLAYFGETSSDDCHLCDVCVDKGKAERSVERQQAEQIILKLLSDGAEHTLESLQQLPIRPHCLAETLHLLLEEERIEVRHQQYKIRD